MRIIRVAVAAVLALGVLAGVSAAEPRPPAAAAAEARHVGGVAVGGSEPWNPRRSSDYRALRRANVTWVRGDLSWQHLEPRRGEWNWAVYDGVLADARAAGLAYLGILHTVPGWANGNAGDYAPPAATSLVTTYCYLTARRYLPRGVTNYQVGNEVNLPHPGWRSPSGARYVQGYLAPCVSGLRRAEREAGRRMNIVMGSLAPTDWTGGTNPATFLADVYRSGGRGLFTSTSWHPYTGADNPRTARQMNSDSDRLYRLMAANGDGRRKMWATEFGQATGGRNSISERAQAVLVDHAVDAWYAKRYAGPLFWYTARDSGTSRTDREQHFGLLRHDGTAKPAYSEVRSRLRR